MTEFSKKVLAVVRGIPRGMVMSYAEVAWLAGNARASRAVGTLMRKNLDVTVPCHRVICADGRVGQYNRGISMKINRLLSEGVVVENGLVRRRQHFVKLF